MNPLASRNRVKSLSRFLTGRFGFIETWLAAQSQILQPEMASLHCGHELWEVTVGLALQEIEILPKGSHAGGCKEPWKELAIRYGEGHDYVASIEIAQEVRLKVVLGDDLSN